MSIAKTMTEGEPGIVCSLSDASTDIPNPNPNPNPKPGEPGIVCSLSDASTDIPNPNPNPKPGEPGIVCSLPDALSDIQSRQSDSPNPKPMTERGKRSRPEEPGQIEPKTKKSTSIKIIPKPFPYDPRLTGDIERTASWAYGDSLTCNPVRLEHLPSPPRNPGNLTPPPLLTDIKCKICGGDHGSTYCSYWRKVPDDAKLIEDSCYQILCECNAPIVDGRCPSSVCSGRPRKIAPRSIRYVTPANPIH